MRFKRIGLLFYEYLRYRRCLRRGDPYFGRVHMANLTAICRRPHMQKLVELESENTEFMKILEIGSWAGESAILWVNAIKSFKQGKGMIICVDPWRSYIDLIKDGGAVSKTMEKALRSGSILNLYYHNIRCAGAEDFVITMRGQSQQVLPMLPKQCFDIIYVDGDHAYEAALKDLRNSSLLLKDGGVLCGDDLELQLPDVEQENFNKYLNHDYILDPIRETCYHPGVTRGAWEFFHQKVSVYDGFFVMRKKGDSFVPVSLYEPSLHLL